MGCWPRGLRGGPRSFPGLRCVTRSPRRVRERVAVRARARGRAGSCCWPGCSRSICSSVRGCGSRRQVIAVVMAPRVVRAMLEARGRPAEPPARSPARPPPQPVFDFPDGASWAGSSLGREGRWPGCVRRVEVGTTLGTGRPFPGLVEGPCPVARASSNLRSRPRESGRMGRGPPTEALLVGGTPLELPWRRLPPRCGGGARGRGRVDRRSVGRRSLDPEAPGG